ncbi:28179_t:CDS:10 [Dentiscutata erythropus]|uniref:28179_t:CDS:1 n=1 Tax=Dentiscutata erythropus TaxID=1348616 RepID=A0A9N9HT30_9GLOM|nr:28179_t:CDS:10 [Dentiscutata erythropus]
MVDFERYQQALSIVNQLLVKDLKACNRVLNSCQGAQLDCNVKKPDLCKNLTEYMKRIKETNIPHTINEMSEIILRKGVQQPRAPLKPSNITHSRVPPNLSKHRLISPPTPIYGLNHNIQFRSSPFYDIIELITDFRVLDGSNDNTRNSITIDFRLTIDQVRYLQTSRNVAYYQIRLFCCAEPFENGSSGTDAVVEFPLMCEIQVNDDTLPANTRGIKKMVGSVHPIDITPLCKINSTYLNKLKFVYLINLQLIKKRSVDYIVEQIKNGRIITKEETLRKWQNAAEDDIVLGSSQISLKDPLGYTRIQVPCKFSRCRHVQCFDAYLFFQMNEQTPTWLCPICNNVGTWSDIVVDGYFADILNNTSQDQERIIIEPNGEWSVQKKRNISEEPSVTKKTRSVEPPIDVYVIDDSEDENPPIRPSKPIKSHSSSFNGREIIDLTLSSDEEDTSAINGNKGIIRSATSGINRSSVKLEIHQDSNIQTQPISSMKVAYSSPTSQSPTFDNSISSHLYDHFELPLSKSSHYYDNPEHALITSPGSIGNSYGYYMGADPNFHNEYDNYDF